MSVKINTLEIENVKRIKAVTLVPEQNGLTIIGGNNGQGKTSVLDAISWALGGNKFRPSSAARDGAYTEPSLRVTLSNGLIAERRGKNIDLKVTDPNGNRSGQELLNSFVSQFALDLPRFMNATDKEKADTLLKIIGVGDKLAELERTEKQLYNERTGVGRIADQKLKYAENMKYWEGVPEKPVSAYELIQQQQAILAKNGENQRKREERSRLEYELEQARQALDEAKRRYVRADSDYKIACTAASDLVDGSTAELEKNIAEIDVINAKIRDNLNKAQAEEEAKHFRDEYAALTGRIEAVRAERTALLDSADLPLPELSVEDGKLLYRGKAWDCMSGSEQLRVAAAIVRRLNPECGFVLLDKLEQMDMQTLSDFGKWLESEGLQAIATRVSTGDECSIIIEDGRGTPAGNSRDRSFLAENPPNEVIAANRENSDGEVMKSNAWKPGQF